MVIILRMADSSGFMPRLLGVIDLDATEAGASRYHHFSAAVTPIPTGSVNCQKAECRQWCRCIIHAGEIMKQTGSKFAKPATAKDKKAIATKAASRNTASGPSHLAGGPPSNVPSVKQ